ncbi:hypothetical protein D1646_00735 [Pseudoflavonifractor sp. 60]|uniref:hypothetical protein n=1 Tax=Pseudoflavonifractor sp. 60 TaxID=2304576 RepID=UPI00137072CB|nr:hypothetical protein [Pseudoflavonifractor sp. 60]NBI65355.1 hypothetical protein [Pseudoflavonifractor sp. 60]
MGEWIFCLFLIGILVLGAIWIDCLRNGEGRRRTCLVWDTGLFFASLALYLGGSIVLRSFGLAWRSLPEAILVGVVMVSFWAGLGLSCSLCELDGLTKWGIIILAGVVFLVTLWLGLFIFAFKISVEERVIEYQGQTLLEEYTDFPDVQYDYYEYHGPLVRGRGRIYVTID